MAVRACRRYGGALRCGVPPRGTARAAKWPPNDNLLQGTRSRSRSPVRTRLPSPSPAKAEGLGSSPTQQATSRVADCTPTKRKPGQFMPLHSPKQKSKSSRQSPKTKTEAGETGKRVSGKDKSKAALAKACWLRVAFPHETVLLWRKRPVCSRFPHPVRRCGGRSAERVNG